MTHFFAYLFIPRGAVLLCVFLSTPLRPSDTVPSPASGGAFRYLRTMKKWLFCEQSLFLKKVASKIEFFPFRDYIICVI